MPHKQAEHLDLMANRSYLTRFAWLSIGAAVATITLKAVAYLSLMKRSASSPSSDSGNRAALESAAILSTD